jgi:hypothetical protein
MFCASHRFAFLALLIAAFGSTLFASSARASILNRTILKSYFETGDVPTEQQFSNFIDSMINLVDDDITVIGVGADALPGQGTLLGEGTEVGPGLVYGDVAGLSEAWVGQSGFLALSLDIDLQQHYGYLQITAAPTDQYPMFVEYLVYESTPAAPISTASVPEPSALVLAALSLFLLAIGRRTRRRRV